MANEEVAFAVLEDFLPLIPGLVAVLDERPEMTDLNASIVLQAQTRDQLDAFAALKAAFEKRHEWLAVQVVPKLMEEANTTSVTIKGVGRVNLRDDVYVAMPSEKEKPAERHAAFQWFSDNFPDLITNTINGSTLAAWVRRRLKAGDEIPEHVKVTPYTKAVITRV